MNPSFHASNGISLTVVESLRRRHVQAELQLREMEDRFRQDCARQERELELLRIDNNKLKAKIEELRMAQTTPKNFLNRVISDGDSKLISASSKSYCMAREAVETAREELNEIRAKLTSTQRRIQDTRRRRGSSRTRAQAAQIELRRNCIKLEEESRASRMQLRALESHVDLETDRLSKLVDDAKRIRREIDARMVEQNRNDDIFKDREKEMEEIMKETSFLIEVCNVLFEERDVCQQKLAELRKLSEGDYEAYEKTFQELVNVEGRDKLVKARLRDNVLKLEEDVVEAVKEREVAERALHEELSAIAWDTASGMNDDGTKDTETNGIGRQLEEFERYISRLMELTESDNLADVERFVCSGGDGRFHLYSVLNRTQEAFAALEQERAALQESWRLASEGTEADRRASGEIQKLQAELQQIQCDTLDYEQQMIFVRKVIDPVLPIVQSLFNALACDVSYIIAEKGTSELSLENVKLYFAAIEQRLEEYIAAWTQQQQQQQQKSQERHKKQRITPELALSQRFAEPMHLATPTATIETCIFPSTTTNGKRETDHDQTSATEVLFRDGVHELLN